SETRFVFRLRFFQFFERRRDVFRRFGIAPPVSEKSVAQIFVDHAVMRLDDFFASRDPTADQRRQTITRQAATERRKVFNVGHKQPARNIRNLADGPLGKGGSIIVRDLLWLTKNKEPIADDDLVLVA